MKSNPIVAVVVAIVVLTLAGVAGAVAVAVTVDADKAVLLIPIIVGATTTPVAAFLLWFKMNGLANEVQDVKGQINGRMDAHAAAAAEGAKAAGIEAAKETLRQVVAIETAAAKAKDPQRHPAAGNARKQNRP